MRSLNFFQIAMLFLWSIAPQVVANAQSPDPKEGINLWAGFDLGLMQSVPKDQDAETNKAGVLGGGKIFISRLSRSLLLEGGVGWQMSRMQNEKPKVATSQEAINSGTVDREIVETRSGVGELALRYRADRWEIGPAGQVLFGADSTYSPYLGVQDERPNGLLGLGVYHTWYGRSLYQRLGFQVMTDISIVERQVLSGIVQYYVGIPLIPVVREEKVKKVDRIVTKYKEKRRYIVDAGYINFATKQYQIEAHDLEYLQELGEFLVLNRDQWSLIFITSHTDSRGGDKINIDLSKNRANAVSEALLLPSDLAGRVQIDPRASRDPVQSETDVISLARNRRVEIEVVGALNVVSLKRSITLIRQKHRKPNTCADKNCQ